jgi:hypothetical protein
MYITSTIEIWTFSVPTVTLPIALVTSVIYGVLQEDWWLFRPLDLVLWFPPEPSNNSMEDKIGPGLLIRVLYITLLLTKTLYTSDVYKVFGY